jgi:hypothetical protein
MCKLVQCFGCSSSSAGPASTAVVQVKSSTAVGGYGGDWAVRIRTGLSEAGKRRQDQEKAAAAEAGSKPRKRKLSLLLYFADAHWRTGEVELWPDGQQSKLGQVWAL